MGHDARAASGFQLFLRVDREKVAPAAKVVFHDLEPRNRHQEECDTVRIMMVSPECAPLVKVGGLGDMVAALATALSARGHDVRIVLPRYGGVKKLAAAGEPLDGLPVLPLRVGQSVHPVRYYRVSEPPGGTQIYLVASENYFTADVYNLAPGRRGDQRLGRASLLAQAALALPALLDWPVDVVHCHDAQAALAAIYRRYWYAQQALPGPAGTLLTIHNLAHQEIHGPAGLEILGLPAGLGEYPGPFEFHGNLNLLKAGLLCADLVNTVSPGYAAEVISDPAYGCGLEGVLRGRGAAFSGILNGADYETWDPRHDPLLPARYGPEDLSGKQKCRDQLTHKLGLETTRPLVGMVGRLVPQKGFDLVVPALDRLLAEGLNLVVLGTGDPRNERVLARAAAAQPDRIAFVAAFDETLAHLIYAGSDMFLMPSLFEPCGLAQMYALRYGSPPIVRATGGLADTVVDAADAAGTGFVFRRAGSEALLLALRRARTMYEDREAWRGIVDRGMRVAFSWTAAARQYEDLYRRLSGGGISETR